MSPPGPPFAHQLIGRVIDLPPRGQRELRPDAQLAGIPK